MASTTTVRGNLSAAMVRALLAGPSVRSGRGGVSAVTMRALAERGLVTMGMVYTWETVWHRTRLGEAVAEALRSERRAA